MKKSMIGVTPLWDAERQSVWMLPDYLDGIKAAGGLPVVLPLEMSEEDVNQVVETCDGFLFTGGQDVSPVLYGMKDATGTIVASPERDKMETLLLSKALHADKAVLGICRGLQFINVFLDGTLWQDLPSQHPSEIAHRQGKPYGVPSHQVKLSGDLKSLLGKDILSVWDLMSCNRKSLRRSISMRKLPSPQAGSRKRLSSRNDSSCTKSSMAFTSRGLVNTSPWSATLWRLLICIVFSILGIKNRGILLMPS